MFSSYSKLVHLEMVEVARRERGWCSPEVFWMGEMPVQERGRRERQLVSPDHRAVSEGPAPGPTCRIRWYHLLSSIVSVQYPAGLTKPGHSQQVAWPLLHTISPIHSPPRTVPISASDATCLYQNANTRTMGSGNLGQHLWKCNNSQWHLLFATWKRLIRWGHSKPYTTDSLR